MKQTFKKTILISILIYGFIALAILVSGGRDTAANIGLTGLVLGVLFFFLGLLLCIPKQSREIGKALLLSAGLIFLVGVSVCSFFQSSINFH